MERNTSGVNLSDTSTQAASSLKSMNNNTHTHTSISVTTEKFIDLDKDQLTF